MMDHNVHGAITRGLRLRGIDVLTAEEDGSAALPDDQLLQRATNLGRVLFSQDQDLIREARNLQAAGEFFAGVVYAHQIRVTIGTCVNDLTAIASCFDPAEMHRQLLFLPI